MKRNLIKFFNNLPNLIYKILILLISGFIIRFLINTSYEDKMLIDMFISGNFSYFFEKVTNFIFKNYTLKSIRPRDLILTDYSFKEKCKRKLH